MKRATLWGLGSAVAMTILLLSCGKNSPTDSKKTPPPPATFGSLLIEITGLPSGLGADIAITGPNNYSRQVTVGTKLDSLTPGEYTITPASVTDSSGASYDYTATPPGGSGKIASSSSSTITVIITDGKLTSVTVSYRKVESFGSMQINVTGLPNDVGADITIFAPSITTPSRL